MDPRYAIAPQLADYDALGKLSRWVPYVMSFGPADRVLPSVSTDGRGFRVTLDREARPVDPAGRACSVLVGGSTAFGVGASSDRHTIPSILNRTGDGLWVNFGGRAFNSTQELLAFMLHLPERVERIVVLSGVNNVFLAFVAPRPSSIYSPFFNQREVESAMEVDTVEEPGDFEARYASLLTLFRRDLRALRLMAEGFGAKLTFAVQPFLSWLNKALTPEERELLALVDQQRAQAARWQVDPRHVGEMRDRYFADLSRVCAELGVGFCNLNEAPAFREPEWLFVDRVHLTDRGHALAADLLRRELSA